MRSIERIALVTDFGGSGPYVGQMKLRLAELAPGTPVADLVSDLSPFRPELAAYLLPALTRDLPEGSLYVCVVDPGVGGERAALALEVDGDWYVGPDNGLLSVVARRAAAVRVFRVDWRPEELSDSFHGRDLFAPVAAMLSRGDVPQSVPLAPDAMLGADWPDELAKVIYADRYGNLITGLLASSLDRGSRLRAGDWEAGYARTFCEAPPETPFWYENAFGLVELAVNQGRADLRLGLGPGDPVVVGGGSI
ncbi:MAG: SAM-dependent chlorinase/fluorinase [Pseudomonadota bacterium]|nr:SAM-dependent chlorinase/fluorinase [Pseudomonadota bacterium]